MAIGLIGTIRLAVVQKVTKILRSFRNYRTHGRLLATVLLLAFAFQFNVVVINKVYTLALHIDIDFSLLVVIIPLIYLTEAFPISINGLGVRESAFAFFFVMNGLTAEEGIAVSLLIVAERYLLGIVGGSLLLASLLSSRLKPVGLTSEGSASAPGP
jgi:glycosyltransferase 2 family protein